MTMEEATRTKIICTMGPSLRDHDLLFDLIGSGMRGARLNLSHSDHGSHERDLSLLREASESFGRDIAVIFDVQGPRIRTGRMRGEVVLEKNDEILVTSDDIHGDITRFSIDLAGIEDALGVDDLIHIDDGKVRLRVVGKEGGDLRCLIESGGPISDHKGCNIPGADLLLELPTKKDIEDLQFVSQLDADMIALSFVKGPEDILKVKDILGKGANERLGIISKVERRAAIENIAGIMELSDALLIARGDLGVEMDPSEVPAVQKDLIWASRKAGCPVIVATQMLESMTRSPRPTRAEAADVFNAVLDGSDAVMLSGETAVGSYPLETVRTMGSIIRRAEDYSEKVRGKNSELASRSFVETSSHAVSTMAEEVKRSGGGMILAFTESGFSARMISRYRPPLPIRVITPDRKTARGLNLVWGIEPEVLDKKGDIDLEGIFLSTIGRYVRSGMLCPGQKVICVANSMSARDGGMVLAIYGVEEASIR